MMTRGQVRFGVAKMRHRLWIAALFLFIAPVAVAADNPSPLPTVEEIVSRMAASDLQRQASMEGYAGMRKYIFENQKMNKRAEMLVKVKGDQDGTKHFEVVSEDGWKAAHTHVLRKMLESESETSHPEQRAKSKLTLANYDFEVLRQETLSGRAAYVLQVIPKRKEKYLFQGQIWVDSEDYALVRAEGSPAKNPSFWTKSTHFVQVYQKNGSLWFPLSTRSVTEARIFGTTDVNIEYFGYAPQGQSFPGLTLVSTEGTFQP
jgi:outer membrane lipoprotein-sorting protein